MHKGVLYGLLAAALFGVSTPFSKQLTGSVDPVMLAGLLYLGSGSGLAAWVAIRRALARGSGSSVAIVPKAELPWLAGATLFGGIAGPVLLMVGLANTPASSASLLLNLEGVLTAMLAWFVFKENFDRRIFFGMLFIVMAGRCSPGASGPNLAFPRVNRLIGRLQYFSTQIDVPKMLRSGTSSGQLRALL